MHFIFVYKTPAKRSVFFVHANLSKISGPASNAQHETKLEPNKTRFAESIILVPRVGGPDNGPGEILTADENEPIRTKLLKNNWSKNMSFFLVHIDHAEVPTRRIAT